MLYKPEEDSSESDQLKPQIILGLTNSSLLFLPQNQAEIINKSLSNQPYKLVEFDNISPTSSTFVPLYKEKVVKQKFKRIKEKKPKIIKEKEMKPLTYENMLKQFRRKQKKQPKPKKEKKISKQSIENEYYTKKLEELLNMSNNNIDDDNNSNVEIDENELNKHLDLLYSISKAIENKSDRRNRTTKSKPVAERRKEIFEKMKEKLNQEQIVDIAKNILRLEQMGNQICFQPEDIKKKHLSQIEKKIKEYDEINQKNPLFVSVKDEMTKRNNNLSINEEAEQIKNILSNSDLSDSLSDSEDSDQDEDSL